VVVGGTGGVGGGAGRGGGGGGGGGGRDFPHLSRPTIGPILGPTQFPTRGKERPGRDADTSPSSSAVVIKE
jgi:hypothetical protein